MAEKNKYYEDINRRAEQAKLVNKVNRNKGRAYSKATPTITNVLKSLYYKAIGNPHIAGENELGALTGVAPASGRKSSAAFNPRGDYNSTVTRIGRNGTKQTVRLNPLPRTGKHSAKKPKPSDAIREEEGTLKFPWNYEASIRFGGTPNQWKAGAAMGATAAGVTAGVPFLNKYTDKLIDNHTNNTTATNKATTSASNRTTPNVTQRSNQSNAVTNTILPEVTTVGTRRTSNTKPTSTNTNTNNNRVASPTTRQANTTAAQKVNNATSVPVRNTAQAKSVNRTSNINNGSYKIQSGDTLYDIAKRLTGDGNNYRELARYNNITDPTRIYAGDTLKIPDNLKKKNKNKSKVDRVKQNINFRLPENLDEDYAQLQPREGYVRRSLESAGKFM